jgi:fatty-acyl-CoA synthase
MKLRKVDLVSEGFDPSRTKHPLWFRDPKRGYIKITKSVYERITSGAVKF